MDRPAFHYKEVLPKERLSVILSVVKLHQSHPASGCNIRFRFSGLSQEAAIERTDLWTHWMFSSSAHTAST